MSCKYAYMDGIGHYECRGATGYDEHLACSVVDNREIDEPEVNNLTDEQCEVLCDLVEQEFKSGCSGNCFILSETEQELKDRIIEVEDDERRY